MYCALAFKNTYFFFLIKKNIDINITHEKKRKKNSIIETVENKIKAKSQFINEKISEFLNFSKSENGLKKIDYMEQSTKQKP